MKPMDHASNVSEEDEVVFKRQGISEVQPMARPALKLRLHHFLFGCTPIKHLVMNHAIGKVVEIGRICPFCFKEYPSGR